MAGGSAMPPDVEDFYLKQKKIKRFPKKKQFFFSASLYLLLEEECRAYLIDLRTEWFGSSRRTWYINLQVNLKTFMFVLSVHLGLLLSKAKRLF